jgi:hypothetical protein
MLDPVDVDDDDDDDDDDDADACRGEELDEDEARGLSSTCSRG